MNFEFLFESPALLRLLVLPRSMFILLDESLKIPIDEINPDVIEDFHVIPGRCLLCG